MAQPTMLDDSSDDVLTSVLAGVLGSGSLRNSKFAIPFFSASNHSLDVSFTYRFLLLLPNLLYLIS